MYTLVVWESGPPSGSPLLSRSSVYLFVKLDWRTDSNTSRKSNPHLITSTPPQNVKFWATKANLDEQMVELAWTRPLLPRSSER